MDCNEMWKMCQDIMLGMTEKDLMAAFGTEDTSVIFDMSVQTIITKYTAWRENTKHYQRAFTRGDVVMCEGAYYVIVGYWGDMKHVVEAMSPDGRIESLRKEEIEDKEIHLDIYRTPLGNIQTFLSKMQENKDAMETEWVKVACKHGKK